MGHQQQFVDDPFASSISSLEADIFSAGAGQLPSPQWQGLNDVELYAPVLGANAATSSGGGGSSRKTSHNAYERDRRKQLNELYSTMRSLLPDADHSKKLSIPTTVTRVLKYIPELQKQVDGLEKKKEQLTRAANSAAGPVIGGGAAPVVVSAASINDREIMVHVSLLGGAMAAALPQSKCIRLLENEGLQLISSSTSSMFENRTFYSLHLKRTQRTLEKDCPAFCQELEKIVKRKAGLLLHL